MKKETKELLLTAIKDYMNGNLESINVAIAMENYDEARWRSEDMAHYCNCLDQFEDVEDIEKMTNEEFSNYFSTFESWQLAKEWLMETSNWEDDIRLLAEQNGLEDGVNEVIEILKS